MGGVFKRFFALFIPAFVSMGLGMAEEVPALVGVTGFVVLVLAAVADVVWSIRRIRKGWPELMEMPEAIRGTAEILEAYETNLYAYMGEPEGYAPKTYALDLRVNLPDRPVYEIRHYTTAHRWATSHLVKGNRVPVHVHPTKPKRMHVDFGEVPGEPAGTEGAGRVDVKVIGGESMLTPEMIVTVTNTRLDLAASGVASTATVWGVKSLGFTSAVGPIIELNLEVKVPGGAPTASASGSKCRRMASRRWATTWMSRWIPGTRAEFSSRGRAGHPGDGRWPPAERISVL